MNISEKYGKFMILKKFHEFFSEISWFFRNFHIFQNIKNHEISEKSWNFWKIMEFLKNMEISEKSWNYWKIKKFYKYKEYLFVLLVVIVIIKVYKLVIIYFQ